MYLSRQKNGDHLADCLGLWIVSRWCEGLGRGWAWWQAGELDWEVDLGVGDWEVESGVGGY